MPEYVDDNYTLGDRPLGSIPVLALNLRPGDQICAGSTKAGVWVDGVLTWRGLNYDWCYWSPAIVDGVKRIPGGYVRLESKAFGSYPKSLRTYQENMWFLVIRPDVPPLDLSAFPHRCPRCGGPAYINLFNAVDCKARCQ